MVYLCENGISTAEYAEGLLNYADIGSDACAIYKTTDDGNYSIAIDALDSPHALVYVLYRRDTCSNEDIELATLESHNKSIMDLMNELMSINNGVDEITLKDLYNRAMMIATKVCNLLLNTYETFIENDNMISVLPVGKR